ncbi:MAG TPA: response regulator [Bacteroidales bacterium]|nr:response regulator [Bacteroidales bacterium]
MITSYQLTLGTGYIMAVEDSLVQAKKLRHFLDEKNINNAFFTNAKDALAAAHDRPPLLIISDIVMPGMDGYEFCAKIKEDPVLKDIPVILLTSLRDPLDIIKGLQAGADNFITKPYEEEYLLSRIHYLLANRDMKRSGGADLMIEIMFRGNKYQINSEKKQILDLLLSVYEAAVQRNDQLISTQIELETSNENLVRANQELEAFSYTVSHDLRSPLNVVSGYVQILQSDYSGVLDPEAIEFLDRILEASFSMARLIDDLLQFSRSGRLEIKTEQVDLTLLAGEVMKDIQQRDPSRKITLYIQDGMQVVADRALMRVVLDNLLGNAWKYTGKVLNPVISFGQMETATKQIFYVRDNGAGFDSDRAEKLFNPFQRFHSNQEFQGTGVGLATVRRILERHGGRIWAESKPHEGAAFYFTI